MKRAIAAVVTGAMIMAMGTSVLRCQAQQAAAHSREIFRLSR